MNSQQLVWNAFGSYVRNAYPAGSQAQRDTAAWFDDLYARRDVIEVQPFHAERTYNDTTTTVDGLCLNGEVFVSTQPFVLSLPTPTPLPGIKRADRLVGIWLRPSPVPDVIFERFIERQIAPFIERPPALFLQPYTNSVVVAKPYASIDIRHQLAYKSPYIRELHQETFKMIQTLHKAGIIATKRTTASAIRVAGTTPKGNLPHHDVRANGSPNNHLAGYTFTHRLVRTSTGFITTSDMGMLIESPPHATSSHLGFTYPKSAEPTYKPGDLGIAHRAVGDPDGRAITLWETEFEIYRPDLPTQHPWHIKLG